jgi:hypothetical protein
VEELELSGGLQLWVTGAPLDAVRGAVGRALESGIPRSPSMCVVSELPGGVAQIVADFKDDLESARVFCFAFAEGLRELPGEVGLTARAPGVPLRGVGSVMERGPVVWAVLVPDPPFVHGSLDTGVSPELWGELAAQLVTETPLVSIDGSLNGVPLPVDDVAAFAVDRATEDPAGGTEFVWAESAGYRALDYHAGFFISLCVEVGASRGGTYWEVLDRLDGFLPRLAGAYLREARLMDPLSAGEQGDDSNCTGTYWTAASWGTGVSLFDVWHLNVVPVPLLDDPGFRAAINLLGGDAELDGRLLTVGTPQDWAYDHRESSEVVARARAALRPFVVQRT